MIHLCWIALVIHSFELLSVRAKAYNKPSDSASLRNCLRTETCSN